MDGRNTGVNGFCEVFVETVGFRLLLKAGLLAKYALKRLAIELKNNADY